MSDTLALAVLNTIQVLFLGYLTYRLRANGKQLNGHLHDHMANGRPE